MIVIKESIWLDIGRLFYAWINGLVTGFLIYGILNNLGYW